MPPEETETQYRVMWQWEGRETMKQQAKNGQDAAELLEFLQGRKWDVELKWARVELRECGPWKEAF